VVYSKGKETALGENKLHLWRNQQQVNFIVDIGMTEVDTIGALVKW